MFFEVSKETCWNTTRRALTSNKNVVEPSPHWRMASLGNFIGHCKACVHLYHLFCFTICSRKWSRLQWQANKLPGNQWLITAHLKEERPWRLWHEMVTGCLLFMAPLPGFKVIFSLQRAPSHSQVNSSDSTLSLRVPHVKTQNLLRMANILRRLSNPMITGIRMCIWFFYGKTSLKTELKIPPHKMILRKIHPEIQHPCFSSGESSKIHVFFKQPLQREMKWSEMK